MLLLDLPGRINIDNDSGGHDDQVPRADAEPAGAGPGLQRAQRGADAPLHRRRRRPPRRPARRRRQRHGPRHRRGRVLRDAAATAAPGTA